jgi:hypothetical protein
VVGVGRDAVGLPGAGGAEHGQDGANTPANSSWRRSGAALLVGALLWALVSVVVATESAKLGMRRRTWGWVASFLAASVVAAYSFGRFS